MDEKSLQELFSYNLKKYLTQQNKTQLDLSKYIGVSNTTINNYVKGYNMPRMDKVDKICQFFNIKRSDLLEERQDTIQENRTLTIQEKKILEPYNKLNIEGQNKVVDYTYDLIETDKYIEEETVEYIGKAAAGNGYNYLDDIRVETTIKKKDRPKYDFIIKVTGDSMEPKIIDGSLAFVRVSTDYNNGKIYVVDDNGTVFIKKVYFENDKITLKSINESYEDIIINFSEGFRILGEVVAWE